MDDMQPFNGLRGICAVAIMLGHQADIFLSPLVPDQEVVVGLEYLQAVSLFFLLSGIPLARLYSTTRKVHSWAGTFDFWRKRFARLAPMYYLTLVLNVLIMLLCLQKLDVRPLLESTLGCVFFLQSWFTSLIDVGGVLWQVAVFVFAYLLFPFLSKRVAFWSISWLFCGILILWLFSAGLFTAVFCIWPADQRAGEWWIWHVHCISRLPHVFAGVLLGEAVERLKERGAGSARTWAITTDVISLILLFTAIQAPLIQIYFGAAVRADTSMGLEAFLLPLHALWLAAMVLASPSPLPSSSPSTATCWTRRVLCTPALLSLGEVSLALYCLHIVVFSLYTAAYARLFTGTWHVAPSLSNFQLLVQPPCWHAPVQWAFALATAWGAERWFETPMRRILSGEKPPPPPGGGGGGGGGGGEVGGDGSDEESAPLLAVGEEGRQ